MRAGNYASGLEGEERALAYLTGLGMETVARRYRGGDGEVDLVMSQGELLIFVEVKYRPAGRAGDGLLAVSRDKRRRLTNAARDFCAKREAMDRPVRFDVVEITRDGIRHVPAAFWAEEG